MIVYGRKIKKEDIIGIKDDEEIIEFDADKEQTKEEIKKLRKQGINDLLDEL